MLITHGKLYQDAVYSIYFNIRPWTEHLPARLSARWGGPGVKLPVQRETEHVDVKVTF